MATTRVCSYEVATSELLECLLLHLHLHTLSYLLIMHSADNSLKVLLISKSKWKEPPRAACIFPFPTPLP